MLRSGHFGDDQSKDSSRIRQGLGRILSQRYPGRFGGFEKGDTRCLPLPELMRRCAFPSWPL
jgi:hypothetical protein